MAAITRLKQEIQFNTQLTRLLDALKAIASQQFQMLEPTIKTNQTFFESVERIAGTFALEHVQHPFTKSSGPMGVIIITSDTGLLGGLNQQVVTTALQEYVRKPGELMVVGERGMMYIREQRLSAKLFPNPLEHGRQTVAAQLRDYALNRVLSGALGSLTVVYPHALSFTLQRVELVRMLPCVEWFQTDAPPSRGVRSGPVLLESPLPATLEYLAWLWVGQKLFDVLGWSRLAELAARSVHLEGSSQ